MLRALVTLLVGLPQLAPPGVCLCQFFRLEGEVAARQTTPPDDTPEPPPFVPPGEHEPGCPANDPPNAHAKHVRQADAPAEPPAVAALEAVGAEAVVFAAAGADAADTWIRPPSAPPYISFCTLLI